MTAICQIRSQAQQISLQTWSDKNLITCKESKMENYFCLAMKEKGWGYHGHFERYTGFFFTVVVLDNYGESLLFKFNLRTCFVFDLLEDCAHDINTLSIL